MQQKPNTENSRTEKKVTNWSLERVRKVAAHNQKPQQHRINTPTTPNKTTNWVKNKDTRKRLRTTKRSSGELLSNAQNKSRSKTTRNFSKIVYFSNWTYPWFLNRTTQWYTTLIAIQMPSKIMTTNDPTAFMMTSPESPPIGYGREDNEQHLNDKSNFLSQQSTTKIDKAVQKIQALNEHTC